MTIYHFILDPRVGGPHVYVKSIIDSVGSRVQQTIITAGKGPLTDIALVNIRHIWKPLYAIEVIINILLILFLSSTRKINRSQSVFNVHGAANIAPIIAARFLSIPVVWHLHETVTGFVFFVTIGQIFLRNGRYQFVVVTQKVADVYGLKDYIVLHSPIDLTYWYSPYKVFHENETSKRVFKILCVANLNPLKGQDVLLDALNDFDGSWELVIIGAPLQNQETYYSLLKQKAFDLHQKAINGRITFLGWQGRDIVRSSMTDCSVFVLPSRSEACPIVLLEAMAMSCVCIATDVGGVSEIINDTKIGYIVPSENPSALRNALIKVRMMPKDEVQVMGRSAMARVEQDFSVKEIAAQYLEICETLIEKIHLERI